MAKRRKSGAPGGLSPKPGNLWKTGPSPKGQKLWKTGPSLLLILVVGIVAYSNSFSGSLIGDDVAALEDNANIRSIWPIWTAMTPPPDTTLSGRPVAALSFAISYAMAPSGAAVTGHHTFNLIIHLATGLLLFGVIRRTLLSPPLRERFASAAAPLALTIAVIWIAHPLNTQAVTFVVQRVESLMSLFYLATLYCTIRAAETNFASGRWVGFAIAACALGMGTKEVMVTAPLLAAAWIWLCRPDISLFGLPSRLLTGLAATWLIVIVLAAAGARSKSAGFGVSGWTSPLYLRTQAGVIGHYLRLVFWPKPLVFQYAWLPAASWADVLPQTLLLVSLAGATVFAAIRRWPIAIAGLAFFLILAPSSSILPIGTEVAAEHRMYLPLAAVVTACVFLVDAVYRRLASSGDSAPSPFATLPGRLAVTAITAGLVVMTYARNQVYASPERMAEDVAVQRPQNAQGRFQYGVLLLSHNQFREAEEHLRAALALPLTLGANEPTMRSLMHLRLSNALERLGKTDERIAELKAALALRPDLDIANGMLAEALLTQKKPGEALIYLDRAITNRPREPQLLLRAAWVLATSSNDSVRNGARAVTYAQQAVALTGFKDPVALDTLGAALAESGQFDKALEAVRQAQALIPKDDDNGMGEMLNLHQALFQARRPVRSSEW